MSREAAIGVQVGRLANVWHALREPRRRGEYVQAISREKRVDEHDVQRAVDRIINHHNGPHIPLPGEVVGMALMFAKQRADVIPERELPKATVIGAQCSKCGGDVELVPSERLLWCDKCKLVQAVSTYQGRPRHHLDWHEVNDLATAKTGEPGSVDDARLVTQAIAERPKVRKVVERDFPNVNDGVNPDVKPDVIEWEAA